MKVWVNARDICLLRSYDLGSMILPGSPAIVRKIIRALDRIIGISGRDCYIENAKQRLYNIPTSAYQVLWALGACQTNKDGAQVPRVDKKGIPICLFGWNRMRRAHHQRQAALYRGQMETLGEEDPQYQQIQHKHLEHSSKAGYYNNMHKRSKAKAAGALGAVVGLPASTLHGMYQGAFGTRNGTDRGLIGAIPQFMYRTASGMVQGPMKGWTYGTGKVDPMYGTKPVYPSYPYKYPGSNIDLSHMQFVQHPSQGSTQLQTDLGERTLETELEKCKQQVEELQIQLQHTEQELADHPPQSPEVTP